MQASTKTHAIGTQFIHSIKNGSFRRCFCPVVSLSLFSKFHGKKDHEQFTAHVAYL